MSEKDYTKLDSEQKYWLTIIGLVVFAICFIAACTTFYNAYTVSIYIKEGYQEVILPGSQNVHWQKK